ncbi:cytochrome c family protein [Phenylobacterium aquaticum]|uniref:c-type cytochrome n=1 Tax=Phenylobacterium aquaticum TaxID=1763816 RepID=UPI0026EC7AE6|nr:cytochrome c family protein [Phenylobacterium aquaticum]
MRRPGLLLAATFITAAALAGCGKPQSGQATGSEEASEPATAPAAAPVELTDAQKATLVATLPAPYSAGDIANGKKVFMVCKSCHTTVQGGANMTGPNLWGVIGRKSASEAGFNYSDGMKALNITWDAPKIDEWIESPKTMVEGTKMSFVGVKAPKDRADLIAYLKTETSPAPQ